MRIPGRVSTRTGSEGMAVRTDGGPAGIGVGFEDAALEAVGPAANVGCLRNDLLLVFMVGNDLRQFVLDVVRIQWLASHGCQCERGFLELALFDEESRGFRQDEQASGENDGPEELHGDGDAVGAGVVAVLGRVDDAVGHEDPDGDAELVAGYQGSPDLFGCDFLS